MRRFPGEYTLLFKVAQASLPTYLALTDAERKSIKREIGEHINDTIDCAKLAAWDFSHNKIQADDMSHKSEVEVCDELEGLLVGLGKNGNTVTIQPEAKAVAPAEVEYDKQFDCGRSCHHTYSLQLDSGNGAGFRPWLVAPTGFPGILFELRVRLMWITPPELVVEAGTIAPLLATASTRARELAKRTGVRSTNGQVKGTKTVTRLRAKPKTRKARA